MTSKAIDKGALISGLDNIIYIDHKYDPMVYIQRNNLVKNLHRTTTEPYA